MRPGLALQLQFAAFGGLAFIFACVGHEAIGHAGACLLTGGKIERLTSVYFQCRPESYFVDAAGPLLNCSLAGIAWLVLRARILSATATAFIALVLGFNAMWGAGYLPYSALTNLGDLAFVFGYHGASSHWVWRVLIAIIGLWLYSRSMRMVSPHLPNGLPLIVAYLSAIAIALTSVLLYSGPLLPAAREAFLEGAIAPIGFLYIALARKANNPSSSSPIAEDRGRWFWPCAIGIVVAFLLLMGRGYSAA